MRDEREYQRIVAYIEKNPVKASLVQRPEDYFWSSASTAERATSAVVLGRHSAKLCPHRVAGLDGIFR